MPDTVMVALIAAGATILTQIGGILLNSRLTAYRIGQLEKKVEQHNNVVGRVGILENDIERVKEDIREIKDKIA